MTTPDQRERALEALETLNQLWESHCEMHDIPKPEYEDAMMKKHYVGLIKAALNAPPHVPQDTLSEVREALEKIKEMSKKQRPDSFVILMHEAETIRSVTKKALATLDRVIEGDGWLPIESAPRDGTRILVWAGGNQFVAYYHRSRSDWFIVANVPVSATHWRPLPTPPEAK